MHHGGLLQGVEALGDAHIEENLRVFAHAGSELGEPRARLLHDGKHLQGADQTVAGGGLVQAQNVTRCFAPQGAAHFIQHGEHVAVAHLCAAKLTPIRRAHAPTRLLITVPTTGPVISPRSRPCLARMRQRSPSTQRPSSPDFTGRHRIELAFRVEGTNPALTGTVSCSSSGAVDPQPSLMLRPFGEQPMGTISAPKSASTRGATLYPAPLAQSITILKPCKFMPAGIVEAQNCWYCVRLRSMRIALPRCCDCWVTTGRSSRHSISFSASSDSLLPLASKNLMPLSSYELCEALMTTPKLHSRRCVALRRFRGRQRTDQHDIDAGGGKTCLERRLEHVARNARVFADEHAPADPGQHPRSGARQAQRKIHGHRRFADAAAHAIGAEISVQRSIPCNTAATIRIASRVAPTSWVRMIRAPSATASAAKPVPP